jgi:hypothetical protein
VKRPGHSLRLLTGAVQGRLPEESAWPTLIGIANRGWLCPSLYLSLERRNELDRIPASTREYLSFIHERNYERNRRLQAQLIEGVRALNGEAIEPVLLKGAIHLFTVGPEDLGARMISDLDIGIAPGETGRAKTALEAIGYARFAGERQMGRSGDAGVIEFHDRPSRRSAAYFGDDLRIGSPKRERDGAVVRIPTATARALHLIVHDMIKEGDYWSFRIDLRHLHDLAELARSPEGVDWRQLCDVLSDKSARGALIVQSRALQDLYAIDPPPALRAGWREEWRHIARLICAGRGPAASMLRLTGNLSRGVRQIAQGYEWRGGRKLAHQVYRRLTYGAAGSRV